MPLAALVCLSLMSTFAHPKPALDPCTSLWFAAPAAKWDEAIPVGNGRLGAMIFGTIGEERIQLNENTLYSGGPYSTVKPGGAKHLAEIQKLVFENKNFEAHDLFGRHLMGYPVEQQKYQSFANLHLDFDHADKAQEYKRSLDLETGIASVEYTVDGVRYLRETFASAPDQAIIVRITSDKPASINLRGTLRGVRNQTHSNYGTDYFQMDPTGATGLKLTGKSADYMGVAGKLRYEGQIATSIDGGRATNHGGVLAIEKANAVTLVFVAATNFVNYKSVSGNPSKRVEATLKKLQGKSFESLREAATKDHQSLFSRATLRMPATKNSDRPISERKIKVQTEPDPSLAALVYNFGRYILIASSRPGQQPANLQGIWNDDQNPWWDSKYTTNINTQMNYWPAESGNLSDLAEPLFRLISEVSDQGAKVAKEHYGARGWVLHQNTDIWRVAAPMDGPSWGTFTVGGAWLCTHLWEHYLYTRDKEFLRKSLPLMEGSVQFFLDFLVKHPNGRWLVTNPSTSPENFPDGGGNRPFFDQVTGATLQGTTICAGSSIDMQILYDLFGYYIEANRDLGRTTPLMVKVAEARKQLVPPQIGASGALQEWADDWTSLEENHRHFSHLYGLYPGRALWDQRTPALIESYKKVLEERGDEGAGWSRAWKMALWARLSDGNRANKILKGYLREQSCSQLFAICGKAMQVDGTLGATAGISEMLVQSHEGFIRVLPALPDEWNTGKFNGVRARGGFEMDLNWADGRLSRINLRSLAGEPCRIRVGHPVEIFSGDGKVATKEGKDGVLEFPTKKGASYEIRVR